MRVADWLWLVLADFTDAVFFVPGGGALHLVDALLDSKLHPISAIHEQGAGFEAIGYSQYSDKLGLCLVTSGPGALNAVAPCGAAWMDSVPVLFVSGQAKSSTLTNGSGLRTRGIQEIDIIQVVRYITKQAVRVRPNFYQKDNMQLINLIQTALKKRPGPVWLDIPLDVQGMEI